MATRVIVIGSSIHAASHATDGDDPIAPASIGAPATTDLADVAFSGDYADLTGSPVPTVTTTVKIYNRQKFN